MQTILLVGKKDAGKTTTMDLVYHKLIELGATEIKKREMPKNKNRDFECVLSYNGKKIGMFTMGDEKSEINDPIVKYKDECDIFLYTCRSEWRNSITISDVIDIEKKVACAIDNNKCTRLIVNLVSVMSELDTIKITTNNK